MEVICSLFEGHYHLGIAGLINSVVAANFKGTIWLAYRDKELPYWVNKLTRLSEKSYQVNSDIIIKFEFIDPIWHYGYYKPVFLKYILQQPEVEKVFYFDPDIVVSAPWSFFSNWATLGVTLCLDNCFPIVSTNHPWRNEWKLLNDCADGLEANGNDYYVNSGYISITDGQLDLLNKWIDLTHKYESKGGDIKKFEKDGFRAVKGDQDLLNAAITLLPNLKISVIGKEGMGFTQPAYLMLHAVDSLKPWKNNFLISALKGSSPTNADKGYWKYAAGTIDIYAKGFLRRKLVAMKIASFLGRFYKK